jgi:AmmeMemoRadiSam system protein B
MVNILKRLFAGDPNLRPAHFAGRLYPRDADELAQLIEEAFGAAEEGGAHADPAIRAVVVPHSDPRLCGHVVAAGLARIAKPERIVILGPSRRVPFRGVAATAAEGWDCPLGWLRVDREAYAPIADLPVARQLEEAHAADPSIEAQVPFLKSRFGDVSIVPVLVGDASIGDLATVIDRLWADDAVIVVASELSEGLPSAEASDYDAETLSRIEAGDVDLLDERQLSARRVVQALLEVAGERGLSAKVVARGNSSQFGGPADVTIGYGAVVLS